MEGDSLLEKLRELKTHAPDPGLTDRVARAALTELSAAQSLTSSPISRWRSFLVLALYRAALPTALAGATVIYLSWAVSAASHLY